MADLLTTTVYASPIGPLRIVEDTGGPLVVEFPARAAKLRWHVRPVGATPAIDVREGPCPVTTALLDSYFDGTLRRFRLPRRLPDWFELSPDTLSVHRALCRVPFGTTRSYQDIANQTGLHPRLVGQIVGSNHLAVLVPCHRIVGKDGALTGYGGGIARKRWLLAHELKMRGLVMR